MLSFKDLNEKKKTAVKINPNLKDVQEKKGEKNCGCGQNPCITYGDGRHKKDKEKSQVEGYQRNPERDTRSARQRRMDSPDRGINSPAFRAFMAAQQKPSKPKKKKDVKEEVVTELNRYEKETGKSSGSMNMPKGRPTKKGGTSSPVMRAVRTSIRKETGKPHGQKKKTKGEKGNRQYGDRKTTPADTIAKRRQSKADAEKLMRDTSGT